jgi:hypothetical protein
VMTASFLAHLWETLQYRHLSACGFVFQRDRVRKSGQQGPDFGIVYQCHTIWIEAVTPAQEGIPQEWLDPPKRDEFRCELCGMNKCFSGGRRL